MEHAVGRLHGQISVTSLRFEICSCGCSGECSAVPGDEKYFLESVKFLH